MIHPVRTKTNREIVCAAGDRQFRAPAGATLYKDVEILRTGKYEPSYPLCVWDVTPELIARLVANYDPNFYAATLNTDHDSWWGPAQGIVLALRADQDGAATVLLADIAITSWWLGQEIDAGMWPARSSEVWDAELFGGPRWIEYPEKADYLLGLAALGQAEPAIPNMGPWPVPIVEAPAAEPGEPLYIAYPIAASGSRDRRGVQLIPVPRGGTEMKPDGTAATAAATDPQTGTAAAVQAQQTITPPASDAPAPVQAAGGQEYVTAAQFAELDARNKALEAQIAAKNREEDVEKRLRAHRADGRLTTQPQMAAYRALGLSLSGQKPAGAVQLSSGATQQVDKPALELVDEIIRQFPKQVTLGLIAHEAPGTSDLGTQAASPVDAAIAERTASLKEGRK